MVLRGITYSNVVDEHLVETDGAEGRLDDVSDGGAGKDWCQWWTLESGRAIIS